MVGPVDTNSEPLLSQVIAQSRREPEVWWAQISGEQQRVGYFLAQPVWLGLGAPDPLPAQRCCQSLM
ncbi:hypothetical protein R50071_35820 [Halioxenophilus aromaticivorans]